MKPRSSWLTTVIIGAIAVIVLTPLLVATVASLLVPAAAVIAVLVAVRFLWYWTSL
ncbi:MAG: hypothetical protein ITG02_00850 [Patulibacter sp.]|nr:hypothetical protein [Patulibacter sp.]